MALRSTSPSKRSAKTRWTGPVELLQVVPELCRDSASRFSSDAQRLPVRVVDLAPGPFDMAALVSASRGWLGVLVLEGLLVAEVTAGRAHAAWLLGAEDLIRPWDMSEIALTRDVVWEARVPSRLALLDARFAQRADAVPGVTSAVLSSGQRTTHWLLAKSLVVSSPVIEERVLLLFALLGERWGRVDPAGVHLALPFAHTLTHSLIGRLVSARRPSVTSAVNSLEDKGVVVREPRGGWLLRRGTSPVHGSCWDRYADALGLI